MEFKTPETQEVRTPAPEDFKKIECEGDISAPDAETFWEQIFGENQETSEDKVEKVECRNEHLAGGVHPETGVPFEKRIVEIDGDRIEVVAPVFESKFDAQLEPSEYKNCDVAQFKSANRQLREAVNNNNDLKAHFSDIELEQIMDGETPDGYTWHHDTEPGKLQLVSTEIHQKTGHGPGGRVLWGGGNDAR